MDEAREAQERRVAPYRPHGAVERGLGPSIEVVPADPEAVGVDRAVRLMAWFPRLTHQRARWVDEKFLEGFWGAEVTDETTRQAFLAHLNPQKIWRRIG